MTAIVAGAFAGFVASTFIWAVEEGTALIWSDLPDRIGVDPFGSWWLFAIPVIGGALVGVGQIVLGNYPRPLEDAVATWKRGEQIDPVVAPKTGINSFVALVAGGPVGFEAALTGVLGGTATWIGQRITTVAQLVRQAWGAERIDDVSRSVHQLPYWLAAVSGLFAFKWIPFGGIDMGFRFTGFDGRPGIGPALAAFVFAMLVVVPAAWAMSVVSRAEHATFFQRSPILIGMAGGAIFALLAVPNELVLFSGQQGIQLLPDTDLGDLAYVTIAKWVALVIALYTGWRGGPIFPTFTSIAALAVIVDELVDVGPDIMIVAGLAAGAVVLLKGSIPMAFVLTLYPVELSYASVILVGCVGGAVGLGLARAAGLVPVPALAPVDAETHP